MSRTDWRGEAQAEADKVSAAHSLPGKLIVTSLDGHTKRLTFQPEGESYVLEVSPAFTRWEDLHTYVRGMFDGLKLGRLHDSTTLEGRATE